MFLGSGATTTSYDLVVIGGGSGGLACAKEGNLKKFLNFCRFSWM